ncbi:MAG: hypothetical protein JNK93_13415 [Planctomycetia bacterium]|nr:hypothetical protein [Planctomycetia bacterium]
MKSHLLVLVVACLTAGCASSARERLKTLGSPPDGAALRDAVLGETKVTRIDVIPSTRSRLAGAEQVVIATVYDRDGKPKPRAKVEWTLEGVGKILAVDEGALLLRGKRVDSAFGYSYTSASRRSILGDRDDPRDDFELEIGQTYCIVTAAEPGRTSVTVQSPDATDAKATARLQWTDGSTKLPSAKATSGERPDAPQVSLDLVMPRAVGVGRDLTATIALANGGKRDSQPLTVKAVVPEGVEILRIDPPVVRRSGNSLTWAIERLAAGETQDLTITLRPKDRGSLTVTASAESADGLRAEQRVGTSVDAAGMTMKIDVPATASTGGTLPVRVTVTNAGAVPIENAIAWVDGPDGAAKPMEKSLGTIPANESKTVTVNVPVERAGKMPVRVNVTADGGLADRAESIVQVGQAELELSIGGSESFPVGQEGMFEFRVTNRGDAPLANVTIRTEVPRPLTAAKASDGGRSVESGATWTVGTLAAGESKVVRLGVQGDRLTERVALSATAEAELGSGIRVRAKETTLRVAVVGQPVLSLRLAEPVGPVVVGGRATWRATIRNTGTAPAREVTVTATLTDEFRPTRGIGPNRAEARIGERSYTFPVLGELPPGATAIYLLDADAVKSGSSRFHLEVRSREIDKPIQEEQATPVERRR